MSARISVVVPVYNGETEVAECLDGILHQKGLGPDDFDVVVVDNDSTDGTARVVEEMAADHTNLRFMSEKKKGSYAARNKAIRETESPYLVFTDVDCRPCERWLRSYLDCAKINKEDGPFLAGGAVKVVIRDENNPYEIYDKLNHLNQELFVKEEGFAATANLLADRRVFDDVGLFDEELLSGGDGEFGKRATKHYPIYWCPKAMVSHGARGTHDSIMNKSYRIGLGFGQRYYRKNKTQLPLLSRLRQIIPNAGYVFPRVLGALTPRTYHKMPAPLSLRWKLLKIDMAARVHQARGRRDGAKLCETPDESEKQKVRGM